MARSILKIIGFVIKGSAYIGVAVLILMMLITVADVFLRYVFNSPIVGAYEISEFVLLVLCFIGIAYCAWEDRHVKMNLLFSRLSERGQAGIEIGGLLIGLALSISIFYFYIQEGLLIQQSGKSTDILGIPEYPFYFIVSFCGLMLSLVTIVFIINSVCRLVKR